MGRCHFVASVMVSAGICTTGKTSLIALHQQKCQNQLCQFLAVSFRGVLDGLDRASDYSTLRRGRIYASAGLSSYAFVPLYDCHLPTAVSGLISTRWITPRISYWRRSLGYLLHQHRNAQNGFGTLLGRNYVGNV
ncbi:hypothetical protein KIN20_003700 [Parelaphostrongylus tenuis]|uniref:Uncharacterized protein n=1 Tax=Parelaphostrongylus tenuis TaxID=148309 RepID=A0AAD5MIP2_PARTN|nr:hypothetical protein KIN20_003700 [Parelaphostrongylus tenuis]